MDWLKFKDKFHSSYHEIIKPFIESGECDDIYAFLKKESGRGILISPSSINTFRVFKEIALEDIKVVLLFMDPYNVFKEGMPIATGIALDCSLHKRIQPTLKQFCQGVENELYNGLNLDWDIENYDLSYLTQQGVMLLNASLTVQKDKAGSHKHIWKPFTEYIIENIINKYDIPIVLFGKDAQEYSDLINSKTFKVSHPASASYNGGVWNTNGIFTELNKIIEEKYGDSVAWLSGVPF